MPSRAVDNSFPLNGDLRSSAVEKRRSKERRVKYRNVNVGLIGAPVNVFSLDDPKLDSQGKVVTWNDRNKYKMQDGPAWYRFCHCHSCRRFTGERMRKKKCMFMAEFQNEVYSARVDPLTPTGDDMDCWNEPSDDDSFVAGIAYSYDRTRAPTTGADTLSYAVTEAVKKFQSKELAKLIKNEYEVVELSDSEEEFELI